MGDTIQRPQPLGPASSRIETIRQAIGFVVIEGTYLDLAGILAPGTYRKSEAEEFLDALAALETNEAIQGWIDSHPLPDPPAAA